MTTPTAHAAPASARMAAKPPARPAAAAPAAPSGPGVQGTPGAQMAAGSDFASLLADEADRLGGEAQPAAPAPPPAADAPTPPPPPEAPAGAAQPPAAAAPPGTGEAAPSDASAPALTRMAGAGGAGGAARRAAGAVDAGDAEPLHPAILPGHDHEAAGGAHALGGEGWQAVHAAAQAASEAAAAPVAPIAPSADGALPSLVAPGERAAEVAPTPAAEPAPPQAHLPQAPGSEAFTQALGQQLRTWLARGVAHARLTLNPAELGPIDVRITVGGGRAEVALTAPVAATRDALAQALPLLTQELGGAGLALAGSDIRDGRPGQQGAPAQAQPQRSVFAAGGQALAALEPPRPAGRGLLDLYA